MKRIVLILLSLSIVLVSAWAGSGLSMEALYRNTSGTTLIGMSRSDYEGKEAELLFTSKSTVDDVYAFTFFGGFTKALSLVSDGVDVDVSSYPVGWFYGVGNAILVPFGDGAEAEVSVGYDASYLEYLNYESRVDHLRIGLRFIQTSYEGLQFSLGLEYLRPLWGRVIYDAPPTYVVYRPHYSGSAFAVSVGLGYQSW